MLVQQIRPLSHQKAYKTNAFSTNPHSQPPTPPPNNTKTIQKPTVLALPYYGPIKLRPPATACARPHPHRIWEPKSLQNQCFFNKSTLPATEKVTKPMLFQQIRHPMHQNDYKTNGFHQFLFPGPILDPISAPMQHHLRRPSPADALLPRPIPDTNSNSNNNSNMRQQQQQQQQHETTATAENKSK